MFNSTFHNTIRTPIPHPLTPTQIINVLHETSTFLTLSPLTTKHEHVGSSTRDSYPVETYDVWETIDALPISGLWEREIRFRASFWFGSTHEDKPRAEAGGDEDSSDANLIAWIEAPLGLDSRAVYRVKRADEPQMQQSSDVDQRKVGANTGSWVLEEQVTSTVNFCLRPIVEGQLVTTRKKTHERVIEEARNRS